jgi:kynureninase
MSDGGTMGGRYPEPGSGRSEAAARDAADPLAHLRNAFVIEDPDLVYLDGNSLGRLPRAAEAALHHTIRDGWGDELVRGWSRWLDLPQRVGDLLATTVLGARPGEVVVADSTSVNLYKLAAAALAARPHRRRILVPAGDFPTDRYILEGLAAATGRQLELLDPRDDQIGPRPPDPAAIVAALDEDVALLVLSHVDYRTGTLLPLGEVTAAARRVGALVLWDLSHSVGVVPIHLTAEEVDLAVGCTYKYLNGGPGAPAFLFVRQELQSQLRQPIWGWFGQRDQFAMGPHYDPRPGIGQYLVGSPPILGLVAVEAAVLTLAEAGIDALRRKSVALTSYLVDLWEAWLAPLGVELASPRDPQRRGGHVALSHPQAWPICQALLDRGVVADYRRPTILRLAPAPAYTRFVDVWEGMRRLHEVVASGAYQRYPSDAAGVT